MSLSKYSVFKELRKRCLGWATPTRLLKLYSQCFYSLLPLKTANTTLTLRFTLIAESINSYTLDRVKAINP